MRRKIFKNLLSTSLLRLHSKRAHLGIKLRAMTTVATSLNSTITLNDGHQMPMFGFGTFMMKSKGDTKGVAEKMCTEALKKGYRLLDTATVYENESEVGAAVRNSGIDRKHVFVTTKIHWHDHGADKAPAAIEKNLRELDIGYIDLYLIHTPGGKKNLETYDVMLEYQKKGLIKSVGVSNFGVHHLEGLREAGKPTPAVNQIELHAWQMKDELVQYCRDHGITVMGFSPLAKGKNMEDPTVMKIAERVGKSYGQVLIRYCVQKGFIVIPKTSNPDRLEENADVFDWSLSKEDMEIMDGLEEVSYMKSRPTEHPWWP